MVHMQSLYRRWIHYLALKRAVSKLEIIAKAEILKEGFSRWQSNLFGHRLPFSERIRRFIRDIAGLHESEK